jgi:hypothetical protein
MLELLTFMLIIVVGIVVMWGIVVAAWLAGSMLMLVLLAPFFAIAELFKAIVLKKKS